ncbi:MAG: protein kinase [Butyrivibrio sp.]
MRCNNCFKEYDDNLGVCPYCGFTAGKEPQEAYMLFAGTVLQERYIVGEVLGFGGFGITYKAFDTKLERIVAIKEYYPSGLVYRVPGAADVVVIKGKRYKDYTNGLTRFLDEARNATKFIDNPNIIDIIEYFEENGTAYFVMELLVGLPLDVFLAQSGGKLNPDDAISIITSVGHALKDIHKEGYIHRDIAPDNIYICSNGKVKLFDFGATRFSADGDKELSVILKPGYAPAEQYDTVNKQGPWTDIYALGATMYQLVTGIKPDESTNRKIKDTVKSPHEIVPGISQNLSNAIMRAMAVEMHLRYQNVDDFIRAIKSERRVVSVEKVKKNKKRVRLTSIIASIVIVSVGIFVFCKNWNKEKKIATLPDADITLWYPSENGEIRKGTEKTIEDFQAMYSNISIEAVAIPAEEYPARLMEALEAGNGPTIYETTGLGEEYTTYSEKLESVYKEIDKGSCYFIDDYKEYYPSENKFPTSFVMPVIFVNTSECKVDRDVVNGLDDIEIINNCDNYFVVSEEMNEYYDTHIDFSDWACVGNGIEKFTIGEAPLYFGSSSDIEKIYEVMSGKCKHYTLDAEKVICYPGEEWSILLNAGEDEKEVAERFVAYLAEDPTAQDYLYMQGEYGDKTKLPINKAAIETLLSDDAQDYELILKNIDCFTYINEK